MRKLLRVLLAVTMFFSIFVAFKVTNVSAVTPTKYTLSDSAKLTKLSFFGPTYPSPGEAGTLNQTADKVFVYKMGDTIHGNLDVAPTSQWKVELITFDGSTIDSASCPAGTAAFSISTINVIYDGKYALRISSLTGEFPTIDGSQIPGLEFYVKYNLTWISNKISNCLSHANISGNLTRGVGHVQVPVKIYVAYPDKTSAVNYQVEANSSGYFNIIFPTSSAQVGNFYVYVQDGYSSAFNPDYDAMVYDTLSNVPQIELNLSHYISPVLLYKDQKDQPVLLALIDQNGNYISGASFTVKFTDGTDAKYSVKEISKGFYRFLIDTSNVLQDNVQFKAHYNLGGTEIDSNNLPIELEDKGLFNPYVDINTIYSIAPYGKGASECTSFVLKTIFDKLPCAVGNAFEAFVGYWPVSDPAKWHIHDVYTSVDGPVLKIDENRYFVERSGEISVSIDMVVWERVNSDCPAWNTGISKDDMAKNALPHKYSKTFKICEVNMGTAGVVTLFGGEQTDSTTVQVDKKVNFAISIDSTSIPPHNIIHIFMVNGCNILPDAFIVDTYSSPKKVSEIWINYTNAKETGISDLPIFFAETTSDIKLSFPLALRGISFNYSNDAECGNHLIVQVFGTKRTRDECGNMHETYPLVAEAVDPIKIIPSSESIKATTRIVEGIDYPKEILAGISSSVELTNVKFTYGTPKWKVTLNGKEVDCKVTAINNGFSIEPSCPLSEEGTLTVYGYAYSGSNCAKIEEVKADFKVIKPEFTVKIELLDGTIIDNDHIITEGFNEKIYVTPKDPRDTPGIYDFTKNHSWTLEALPVMHDSQNPSSEVCFKQQLVNGDPSLIEVTAFDNPLFPENGKFNLFIVFDKCSKVLVDTFEVKPPTVKVDPAEIAFSIPATATRVTFSVTDAHGKAAPGVSVNIKSYPINDKEWSINAGTTGKDGTVSLASFIPPHSGRFNVGIVSMSDSCNPPCGWNSLQKLANIEVVYKSPVVDTTPPVVEATAPAEVNTPSVTVTGKVTDNVGVVSLWIGATKASFASDGTFSASVPLVEGANTIKIVAYDAAANKGEKDLTVTYKKALTINASAGIGGSISPSGTITVNSGDSKTFTITPYPGYKISNVKVDGASKGPISSYTFSNITSNHNIEATFDKEITQTVIILQIGNKNFTVNGVTNTLDSPPVIKNSRTLLPIRAIIESLGGAVSWDATERKVTVSLGSTTIELWIGKSIAKVNGIDTPIDLTNPKVVPEIINSRTMLPLRFVAENLGCDVQWNGTTKTIIITYPKP